MSVRSTILALAGVEVVRLMADHPQTVANCICPLCAGMRKFHESLHADGKDDEEEAPPPPADRAG